ncbi:metallophosphoesterase [Bacillus sp. DTU_2020_1000418_1_SI_GHA_SEK_038]|uniref:metallophosphoesterase family protein n=1 Tax=Bacillus sp. DTU_2020_1000418_1_SI_GHA_SEK_038 TaxID=3077585 RepID=UPI0028EB1295|nr:metallophosphoesterase [Bacillus sp. DTU_2020_1000418_1_SI_GHA_SEK_038]WNS74506.1 metallophosphoesterase [Bacillus sp. DTU_2020_1000418_1_SI_GHA_SEK_038]
MRILIVSDSHGLTGELTEIKKHSTGIDKLIHCGDSELISDHPGLEGFTAVRGNCDFDNTFPEEHVEDIGGHRVFITHGHRYSVKSTLLNLSYRAKELGARIVCFGHSHYLGAEMIDGILFINPGSIRKPRGRKERTYVIIDIEKDEINLSVYDLKLGEISELSQKFLLT